MQETEGKRFSSFGWHFEIKQILSQAESVHSLLSNNSDGVAGLIEVREIPNFSRDDPSGQIDAIYRTYLKQTIISIATCKEFIHERFLSAIGSEIKNDIEAAMNKPLVEGLQKLDKLKERFISQGVISQGDLEKGVTIKAVRDSCQSVREFLYVLEQIVPQVE